MGNGWYSGQAVTYQGSVQLNNMTNDCELQSRAPSYRPTQAPTNTFSPTVTDLVQTSSQGGTIQVTRPF